MIKGAITLLIILFFSVSGSHAQFIWSETFPYATSGDLTTEGFPTWDEYGSGSANVQLGSGSIAYPSYVDSGVGNHIILDGDGQAVISIFPMGVSVGSKMYVSFMINITAAPVGEVELLAFDETPPTGSDNYGFLMVKAGGGANTVQFALKKSNSATAISSYTSDIAEGVHLIVVSYDLVTGGTTGNYNDVCELWVDPDLSGSEPPATTTWNDNPVVDALNGLGSIIFFTPTGVTTQVAGIRVATAWSDAPLPVQLSNFATTSTRFGADLHWTTASEINNYGFEIERRTIGSAEVVWSTVGFVQGAGTSTSPREYSYADANVEPGRYAYRIKQIDMSGAFTYYSAAEVEVGLGPKELALEPNYPNPFNPSTNITFTVPVDGRAALKVYNMLGQEVAILFDEEAVAGRVYRKTFDASSLPTGVYVSRLEFGGQSVMRKMLFVK